MFLEIKNITVQYEKSVAIREVSLQVPENAVVSIIGANGAGKSTLLRALVGLTAITSGKIFFIGDDVTGKNTTDIVRLGISLVPENRQLFPHLSVMNNLRLGALQCRDKKELEMRYQEIYRLFPRLQDRYNQKAGTLSGGEQQMVAIGRALMARPRLLCMDEPSLGLAPIVIEQLGEVIRKINKRGMSVLLVEQNVHLALGVANRGYLLQVGRIILEGDTEELKSNEIVKKAYLGG